MTLPDLTTVTCIQTHAGFQDLPADDLARIERAIAAQKRGAAERGHFDPRTGALEDSVAPQPSADAVQLKSVTTIRRHGRGRPTR